MGVFNTRRKAQYTMKVQFILAACLVAAAFAAPIDNFVDPDCIEEDLVVEEPSQEIDADFALGLPDLRMDFGNNNNNNNNDDECEDDAVTEPVPEAADVVTEECEDPLTTEDPETFAAPESTEAECEEPLESTTQEATPEPTTPEAGNAATDAEECQEEFTTPAAAPTATEDECAEEGAESAPELDIRIEPAAVVEDLAFYGEEHMIPDIEECEE